MYNLFWIDGLQDRWSILLKDNVVLKTVGHLEFMKGWNLYKVKVYCHKYDLKLEKVY